MKKKIFSIALIFMTISLLTANLFFVSNKEIAGLNCINDGCRVEKLDDNNAIIHYGSDLKSTPDLLITKEANEEEFNYKFFDNTTKKEIYSFATNQDILLDDMDFTAINAKPCALAWALFHAIRSKQNPAAIIGELFGTGLAVAIEGTLPAVVSLIASEGVLAIPAVIGLLSGLEAVIVACGVGGIA